MQYQLDQIANDIALLFQAAQHLPPKTVHSDLEQIRSSFVDIPTRNPDNRLCADRCIQVIDEQVNNTNTSKLCLILADQFIKHPKFRSKILNNLNGVLFKDRIPVSVFLRRSRA